MKFLFIFLLALAVYGVACKKENEGPYVPVKRCPDLTNNMNTLSMYIKGKWQFVEEKRIARYNGTEYFTPTSQGWGHQTIIFLILQLSISLITVLIRITDTVSYGNVILQTILLIQSLY